MERNREWHDQWAEVHYQETAQIIAAHALARQQHNEQWWRDFNEKMEQQPETD